MQGCDFRKLPSNLVKELFSLKDQCGEILWVIGHLEIRSLLSYNWLYWKTSQILLLPNNMPRSEKNIKILEGKQALYGMISYRSILGV